MLDTGPSPTLWSQLENVLLPELVRPSQNIYLSRTEIYKRIFLFCQFTTSNWECRMVNPDRWQAQSALTGCFRKSLAVFLQDDRKPARANCVYNQTVP